MPAPTSERAPLDPQAQPFTPQAQPTPRTQPSRNVPIHTRAIIVKGIPTSRKIGKLWRWMEEDNKGIGLKIIGARWLLQEARRVGKLASSVVLYLPSGVKAGTRLRMGQKWFTTCVYDFDRGSTKTSPPAAQPPPPPPPPEFSKEDAPSPPPTRTAIEQCGEPSMTTSELEELAARLRSEVEPTHSDSGDSDTDACGQCGRLGSRGGDWGQHCTNLRTGEAAIICWDCCTLAVIT